jgi:hypothetical protein
MNDLGMEPWQQMFHDQWAREAARRSASVPDGDDMWLYGGYEGDDDE